MSITPTFFRGRRTTVNDPLSVGVSSEIASLADTNIKRKETADAHVFTVNVPGLKKEEVKVEVEDDRILLIRGVRNAEKQEKTGTWHRVERSSGKFLRRFSLPKNAKVDQVKAEMENGVLTVTVPKM